MFPVHLLARRTPVGLLLALLLAGCSKSPPSATPPGEKPKSESDLSRTTLSSAAYRSLGVKSEPARIEAVREHRELTGWVIAPQGDEVPLTAPVPGIVRAGKKPPVPGMMVEQGWELFSLEPVVPPLDRVQLASLRRTVDSDVIKATESVRVAQREFDRIKELFDQKLRSEQEFEQAKQRLAHAKEDLAAATDRQKLFALEKDPKKPLLPPQPIEAPRKGRVLSVAAAPGQYVPAGAPLVTVIDLSRSWLRVPVPEQVLSRVNRKADADVVLAGRRVRAALIDMAPVVDLDRRSADVFYSLPAAEQSLLKDERLTVFVPLGDERKETVVPYSTVVFDAYAGAWVYLERTAEGAKEHVFERRRVELGPSVGMDVVIRPGLKEGDRVVVAGAAALFSREFHKPPVGKNQDGDDD